MLGAGRILARRRAAAGANGATRVACQVGSLRSRGDTLSRQKLHFSTFRNPLLVYQETKRYSLAKHNYGREANS